MRYSSWCASLFGIALLFVMSAGPANAQATRTWVSGVGDDANPCSRTAPCKTFAGAISKTDIGGEINALDPGGFGAVTITKSIVIRSETEAGVLVSGTNGIVVNTPSSTDVVLLEGLDIEGLGTGINGIQIIGSGTTTIVRCSIRHFTGNGVNLVGAAGARAVIVNSQILNNGGGLNVQGAAGATNVGLVLNSYFDNNPNFATQVAAPSKLILSAATLLGAAASINATGGAAVISFGNNAIGGTGTPTQIITLK